MRVFAALALLFCLTPGLDEALEQIIHVLETGHVAHLTQDETDLGHDEEHGCRPNAHACGCCTNVPVVNAVAAPSMTPPKLASQIVWSDASPPHDRARDQVFRPPIQG